MIFRLYHAKLKSKIIHFIYFDIEFSNIIIFINQFPICSKYVVPHGSSIKNLDQRSKHLRLLLVK